MSWSLPGRRRLPAWAAPAAVTGAGVSVLITLAGRDPDVPGHYPVCPLLATTGWYCPGCGALRGLAGLARGDFAVVPARNALLPLGIVLLGWAWLAWTGRRTGWWHVRPLPRSPRFDWAILAVVVAFTVLRNTPFGATLAP